jgi:peptide/nickel transport system permease protein
VTTAAGHEASLPGVSAAPAPDARPAAADRARGGLHRSVAMSMGSVVLLTVLAVALLAPLIATHDPIANSLVERLRPPTRAHFFGTDDFGRDVFSRVVWGARVSLMVALVVVGIAAIGGASVGLVTGYVGGRLDHVAMRLVDMMLAFPALLLALAVMAGLGSSLLNVVIAVAVAFLPRFARLQRAVTLTVREREFVTAAVALGGTPWRVLVRHVAPNCLAPALVMVTVSAADAILVESSLSFLGLGVQPPAPTWGAVISDGRAFLQNAPWISGLSGAAIMLTVLGLNLLGDGLRDLLDPTLRGEGLEVPKEPA